MLPANTTSNEPPQADNVPLPHISANFLVQSGKVTFGVMGAHLNKMVVTPKHWQETNAVKLRQESQMQRNQLHQLKNQKIGFNRAGFQRFSDNQHKKCI
jgi:hypothetical protein